MNILRRSPVIKFDSINVMITIIMVVMVTMLNIIMVKVPFLVSSINTW